MPKGTDINPKTGRRYNWVDPRKVAAAEVEELKALNSQIALLERQQMALESREKLLTYTRFTMPHPDDPNNVHLSRYEEEVFHTEVAKALEAVERGEIPQLIFCMPPRHGKTELATKRFTAWLSGKHPEWDIAVASYSDTMAQDMGADTRAILTSPQHKQVFPGYALRRGGNAKDNIQTVKGGRLVFVGRGGALTGRGMHVGLGDDLFKDHEEARSQAVRDSAWNWFTKVFMTRRMGKKLVVLTMTRWHSDDVIGRLTDPENPHYNAIESSKWKIIRLPAIAEDDDPLGRKPGEALWPKRYDLDFLQSQQRLDPLGFAALYQQSPTVADGVLFKRESFQYYRLSELPADLRYYCASDFALGTGQRHDSTVHLKVGVDKQDNIYVIDCYWRKVASDVSVEAMLELGGGSKAPVVWWAEKGHISKSIGPFLYKRMQETGTYINIREVTPSNDKEQRAQSIAARIAMGKVYFPKDAVWTERALNELLAFPNGTHDDFVDAIAYIGLGLRSQFGAKPAVKAAEEPVFGSLAWVKLQDSWAKERARAAQSGGF
jgi:predicted phage terminase large subunit-like protein